MKLFYNLGAWQVIRATQMTWPTQYRVASTNCLDLSPLEIMVAKLGTVSIKVMRGYFTSGI